MHVLALGIGMFAFVALSPRSAQGPDSQPLAQSELQEVELDAEDLEARHALVLFDVRGGQVAGGLERLQALAGKTSSAELEARIGKDIERCRALLGLREKHIADLVAGGKRVTLEHRGKKIIARVVSFADGELALDGAKPAISSLPAEELDLLPLVRSFGPSILQDPDGWARWYPLALAGDPKSAKSIKGSPQADELRSEAESFYAGALRLGEAADLVRDLVQRGRPADAESAGASIATIERLLASFADLPLVASRKKALKTLAVACFEQTFDPSRLSDLVAAKVEPLPDGRVRLIYEFERAEELRDFTPDHGYLPRFRAIFPKLAKTDAKPMRTSKGELVLNGAACWRHVLEFEAPISLEYSFHCDPFRQVSPMFSFGVLDDRAESNVLCQGFGLLSAYDKRSQFQQHSPRPEVRAAPIGEVNTISMRVAEGQAVALENGVETGRIKSGPRERGGMFLMIHAETAVLFPRIVIEARPDLSGARASWSQRKVAELGL